MWAVSFSSSIRTINMDTSSSTRSTSSGNCREELQSRRGKSGGGRLPCPPGAGNNSNVNINQLPPEALALGSALTAAVPNPFFGIPEFGPLSSSPTIARGQLLRPFPEFQDVQMIRPSIGYGYYNALTLKAERRLDRSGVGFRISYTFAKSLDNYFGDSSYFGQR